MKDTLSVLSRDAVMLQNLALNLKYLIHSNILCKFWKKKEAFMAILFLSCSQIRKKKKKRKVKWQI